MAKQKALAIPGGEFSGLVKSAREAKGWSQTELAKRSRVALRTIVNIEGSPSPRKVRFDVVIRLAAAMEKPCREWLNRAGHEQVSDGAIAQVLKKAGFVDFYGENEPSNLFATLEKRIANSGKVIVSITYCTFSDFSHQECLAEKMAPLINTGRLFLALVSAYPNVPDLAGQEKATISSIYAQVRNEVIGMARGIKCRVKPGFEKHIACFSLKALERPSCFPQVGLSQFRQILIQSHAPQEVAERTSTFELSTWISFFQDQKDRWIPIYPTPEIYRSREDLYRKLCSAWREYLLEIHTGCGIEKGWSLEGDEFGPWEIVNIY